MPDKSTTKHVNHARLPLDYLLWSKAISTPTRILILLAEHQPVGMSRQTLANIIGVPAATISVALSRLSKRGLIAKVKGEYTLAVEAMMDLVPDDYAGDSQLRSLRAYRMSRGFKGIPTPLGVKLAARDAARREDMDWMIPREIGDWLHAKGALMAEARYWTHTLPDLLRKHWGDLIRQGEDMLALEPDEVVGLFRVAVAIYAYRVDGEIPGGVHNPCAFINRAVERMDPWRKEINLDGKTITNRHRVTKSVLKKILAEPMAGGWVAANTIEEE